MYIINFIRQYVAFDVSYARDPRDRSGSPRQQKQKTLLIGWLIWLIISSEVKSAKHSAVFFSHEKTASSTFSQPDQPKRRG
jgi:hypothetical protein